MGGGRRDAGVGKIDARTHGAVLPDAKTLERAAAVLRENLPTTPELQLEILKVLRRSGGLIPVAGAALTEAVRDLRATDPRVLAELKDMIKRESGQLFDVRAAATHILGNAPDASWPAIWPLITQAVADAEPLVQQEAAFVLAPHPNRAKGGGRRAPTDAAQADAYNRAIRKTVEQCLGDQDLKVRAEAIDALKTWLVDFHRQEAANAFTRIGSPDASVVCAYVVRGYVVSGYCQFIVYSLL